MSQRLIVASNIPIEAYGKDTHTIEIIPRGWIKAIHITLNTAITVSAGSVIANASPKSFKVIYNGNVIVHIDGASGIDDKESGGIALLRFLHLMEAGVAMSANYWTIPFKNPLPPGNVVLQIVNQSAEQIGANGSGTITAGDYNVEIEYAIKGKKGGSIPIWRTGVFNDLDNIGLCPHLLPTFPKPIRMLAFTTQDAGAREVDSYDSLEIEYNGQTLWQGKLTKLTNEMQQKAGVATTTGFHFKGFPQGLISNGSNINLKFIITSAGTRSTVEWLVICY